MRRFRGYTQESFAEIVGLDYRHYQKIEAGKVSLRLETLRRIVDGLGFSLQEFFTIEENLALLSLSDAEAIEDDGFFDTMIQLALKYDMQAIPLEILKVIIKWDRPLRHGLKEKLEKSSHKAFEIDFDGNYQWSNPSFQTYFAKELASSEQILPVKCLRCSFHKTVVSTLKKGKKPVFYMPMKVQREENKTFFVWGHYTKLHNLLCLMVPLPQRTFRKRLV